MADQFERAQELDALNLASSLALQERRAASTPKLSHTGECQNPLCGEPLESPRLFCGPICAKQHARRSK